MRLKGYRLNFIGRIRNDGSGIDPVSRGTATHERSTNFEITCLSLTHKLYIASWMSSYIVTIKK